MTVLYRLASEPDITEMGNPFADVDGNMYYSNAVKWAAKIGVAKGVGEGLFMPDENISRQDIAVILTRYAEVMEIVLVRAVESVSFDDDTDIAAYAKDAVYEMQRAGIINGKPGNFFDPDGETTRAEVAAILRRFLER